MTFGPLLAQPVPPPEALGRLLPLGLAALQPEWVKEQCEDECGVAAEGVPWWLARARIDAEVFRATGFSLEDATYVLSTFPQLDREQPPLPEEDRSTVTRDLVLAETGVLLGTVHVDVGALLSAVGRRPLGGVGDARERATQALDLGALPYVEIPQADQSRQWAEDEREAGESELAEEDAETAVRPFA